MRIAALTLANLALALWTGAAQAEDAIAPDLLTAIKDATVYIKVTVEKHGFTGSGFVWKTDGDTAYIVTDHHVVEPKLREILKTWTPGVSIPSGVHFPHDRRGPPTLHLPPLIPPPHHLTPRIIEHTCTNAAVTVVFRSGTPDEQSVRAEVLAADPDVDLAVLKAKNVKHLPTAIKPSDDSMLVETTPVYIVGFPFGKRLSISKGDPTITVGKATISALRRNEAGRLAFVQVDGAMNPGNSGGPVVDSQGRLVGVSELSFVGGDGFAWATAFQEVVNVAEGRLGRPYLYAEGGATIHVEIDLVDPFDHVRSATLHYMILDHVEKKPKPADHLKTLPGCRELPLKIEDRVAMGQFTLKHGLSDVTLAYQGLAVDDAGRERLTNVIVKTIKLEPVTQGVVPAHSPKPAVEEPPTAEEMAVILADLKSGDASRVARATKKLTRSKPKDESPAIAKALATVLLGKGSVAARTNAAWALENWGTSDSLAALMRAARDDPPNIQAHAKQAITNIKARQ